MKVWVAVYEHKYGEDVWVFDTPEKAEAKRQELAERWFSVELPGDEAPNDPVELADFYFDRMYEIGEEFFHIDECEVL